MRRLRGAGHSTFRIQQMLVIWTQPQFYEGPCIGDSLALPIIVGLISLHSSLRRIVPDTGGFAVQVMLADQRLLNLPRALCIDLLLAAVAPVGGCLLRFPVRFLALARRGGRNRSRRFYARTLVDHLRFTRMGFGRRIRARDSLAALGSLSGGQEARQQQRTSRAQQLTRQ